MSEKCSICLKSGPNFVLTCTHKFHALCLYGCLQGKTTFPCPLCRKELSQTEQDRLSDTMLADLANCTKLPIEEEDSQSSVVDEGGADGGSASGADGGFAGCAEGSSAAVSRFSDGCAFIDLTRDNSDQ